MLSEAQAREIFEMVHCPSCGQPAKTMQIKAWGGQHLVAPVYECGTPGCEFSEDGPFVWTPDFTT